MGLSAPLADSLVNIALQTIKQLLGVNQMGCSTLWDNSLDIISLDPVNNNF